MWFVCVYVIFFSLHSFGCSHSVCLVLFLNHLRCDADSVWMYVHIPYDWFNWQPIFIRTVRRLLNGSLRLVNIRMDIIIIWFIVVTMKTWNAMRNSNSSSSSSNSIVDFGYLPPLMLRRLRKWVTDCTKNDIHLWIIKKKLPNILHIERRL